MLRIRVRGLLMVGALALSACDGESGRPTYPSYDKTVVDLIKAESDLSTFTELMTTAGLDETLANDQSSYTVFAPTNAAFAAVPAATLTMLRANPDQLNAFLRFHIAPGSLSVKNIALNTDLPTITSTTVHVETAGSGIALRDMTGKRAMVTDKNLLGKNGQVYLIDAVLTPPPEATPPGEEVAANLLVALTGEEDVSSTLELFLRGGVGGELLEEGPYTIFAPVNDAFEGVDFEMIDRAVLGNIALNHIVTGSFDAEMLAEGPTLTALSKIPLTITSTDPVEIEGHGLTDPADLEAENGYVQGVDGLLLPPTAYEYLGTIAMLSSSSVAVTRGGLTGAITPDTLGGDRPITVFAPTNAAWTASGLDAATSPTSSVAAAFRRHVVQGQLLVEDLLDGQILRTLNGTVAVDIDATGVSLVDGAGHRARVVAAGSNVRTLTGAVHQVDTVLFP